MKWIKCSDRKPETDITVYVNNINHGMCCYVALYYKDRDYFVLFNPEIRSHPPIEVTHWIPLPCPPIIWADGTSSGGEVETD